MNLKNILKNINHRSRIYRLCFMMVGVFLLALNYNMFFVKNELVTGGVSGLAIIFHNLLGWDNRIFIYIVNFILLLISFAVFGISKSKPAIIGSILYPLFISFTVPLADVLAPYFAFGDFITTIVFTSVLYGFANGIVYKLGYNTGGSDIIMQIMCKFLHMPEGRASFISNIVVILFAGAVLGVPKVVYAIIILYISSLIIDRIIIGISKSKQFFIESTKLKEIEHVLVKELGLGATIIEAKGAYTNKTKNLLMCIVSTNDYYMYKEIILEIDREAFIIVNDCYDTRGGTVRRKNNFLPFRDTVN